jgi:hypothetical protein
VISSETLVVVRGDFEMEDPWMAPAACTPVRLRRANDGAPPRLATSVAAWFDAHHLSILFTAGDDHIESTMFAHDAPLYEQDVVEVFLAPEDVIRYFELEVSPHGTVFDARILSPDGNRATMQVDRAWDCEGLVAAVRAVTESDGAMSVDTLLRIPFASLGRSTPRDGERWRANFYRIDRHRGYGDEFSAWQPTMKFPPDFHVPAVFGTLLFGRFPGNSSDFF